MEEQKEGWERQGHSDRSHVRDGSIFCIIGGRAGKIGFIISLRENKQSSADYPLKFSKFYHFFSKNGFFVNIKPIANL